MDRISVSMALTALHEQTAALFTAEEKVRAERAIRDDLIRDARAGGVSFPRIMRETGLSRDRLNQIVNSPSRGVSQA